MIPGDLLSAFPHRQFHTLPGLLDSWAALPNSYPNALRATQGGSLYHFYDGLWYDPAERRTHDLPCERWTRYRLSQPDTVIIFLTYINEVYIPILYNQTILFLICEGTYSYIPFKMRLDIIKMILEHPIPITLKGLKLKKKS